ncbi:ketoacyl-ACP synthase III family protein [Streptomyces sp. AS02]|uniref:ketoacyl-ACP synthase III family protein n=1 Tax=Streptomyces sp. AS02 TaxID=2938946 RepID=UPI002020BB8D|nr:ketoacyl-ACP synthase III family protein [Streptomyces sp. AS02]MCL8017543.1 ketoacyl-ACP synthase III family protein [Streptomyces sp. AS02]
MRWNEVHIAGTGSWLPKRKRAEDAIASGQYDVDEHQANRIVSVTAADGENDPSPPEMAVAAARVALSRSGRAREDVSALLHSRTWFQGAEMWAPASYIAHHAVGADVPAFELLQSCNAGLAALEHAARLLGPDEAALLTTADRFAAPAFDRWRCERGLVYGDGATALVLSSRAGFARLLSTATAVDNSMEAVARGAVLDAVPDTSAPVDLSARADAFLHTPALSRQVGLRLAEIADASVRRALDDAGADMADITRVVLNATGRSRMRWQLELQLGVAEKISNWEFCSEVGHLGAGDHFAGLNDLMERRAVHPGDLVLLVGGGTGYSCTSAVVEITGSPEWETGDGAERTS